MKVFVIQRPNGKGFENVIACFTRGRARTLCVPNYDDRVVEACLEFPAPPKKLKSKAKK